MSVILSRRSLLRTVSLASLASLAVLPGCTGGSAPPLVVAAGESGGFYVEFGELLVRQLRERGIDARIAETGGSVENVSLVAGGAAALGLVLADIAQAARSGEPPFHEAIDLRALGRVYENYMQLVVRAEDAIDDVADLSGRPISMGAQGSGAAVFADRLLAIAGVVAPVARRSLREATAALESGTTDALLWSGGVPTPALAELAQRRPIRLVPLANHLAALRQRHGSIYGRATVPAGVYGAPAPVATVGVANLLVTTAAFPDAVADSVVLALAMSTSELVPPSALGAQYLDQYSLIGTGEIPLHDGAVRAYRNLHG